MIDLSQGLLLGLSTLAHRPQVRPAVAQIAITNRCNTACRMCPRESLEVPDREMPLAKALLAIDRLDGIRKVALVGLGEPLLHPDLDRIIAHAARRGIQTQITSNGLLLDDDDRVRNLFEAGLTHLAFSLEDLRGASSAGHRTRDIARIVERSLRIRDGLPGARPTIAVQVVLLDDSRRSIEEIVRWADRKGVDQVNVSRANALFDPALKRPDPEGERRFFEVLAGLRRRHRIRIDCFQDQIYPGVLGQAYRRMLRLARLETWCIKWSYYVYVDPDGDVFPCSGLFPKEMALGNLFSETLFEIWNGAPFRALRASGRLLLPCRSCDNLQLAQLRSPGRRAIPDEITREVRS